LSIPSAVIKKLDSLSIQYQVIPNPYIGENPIKTNTEEYKETRLRGVGMSYESQNFLAILPYDYLLDYRQMTELMGFEAKIMSKEETQSHFKYCDENSSPLISEVFNFEFLVDPSVLDKAEILIDSGDSESLLKIDKIGCNLLYQDCDSFIFTASPEKFYAGKNNKKSEVDLSFTPTRLKQRIDETFDLPAMPDIAQDIMKLRVDPSADAKKLSQIVSRDPSLAAQVISWASSPYYGYQGKIDSIETAIARVLGFDLVMNLALGISIGKSLKVPKDGPIGVKAFWRQSIYCATLAEKLCRAMPVTHRPERGLIYLSGLLHNFGHLLMGHMFPPQFDLINRTIEANPFTSIEDIEFYILGVTHEEIGAWLMQNWRMPEELIVAVHKHHQEEFWSKHAVYSNLVLVANRMLKQLDIGDSVLTTVPDSTLELLSLDHTALIDTFEDLKLESESLDIMAKQLVA
jgi:HD-like signal output (HDOD) protein